MSFHEPLAFDTRDRFGTRVILTLRNWREHTRKHPEIRDYLDAVRQTVKDPDLIIEDAPGRLRNYSLGIVGGRWQRFYLQVIVRYDRGEGGIVATAWFTPRPAAGEIRWLRRTT